jgi:hypothetical protein
MIMDLNPDFPIVSGEFAMPNGWTLTLPVELNRRIEDGSLVLWASELTCWINIWNNDANLPMQEQAEHILKDAHPARRDEQIDTSDKLLRVTYELDEDDLERDAARSSSISGHVISPAGLVQISAYYDTDEARSLGYQIIRSVRQA